jgi:hypothetical protein
MRTLSLAVVAIIAIVLGGALFAQQKRHHETEAALQKQLASLKEETLKAQRELAELRAKNEVYRSESDTLRQRIADTGSSATAPSATTDGENATGAQQGKGENAPASFMKGVAKMFTDPEMKKAMRGQQGMMVRMMYGDLAKELGLSSEDANQLMELLTERQMGLAAKSMEVMGGGNGDQANLEEAGKTINSARAEYDAQIKGLLGEEKTKQLAQYERTIGDRMQMTQYQQTLTASGIPLEEKQRTGLLDIMREERLKTPPSPMDPGNKDAAAQFKVMQSPERVAEMMKSMQEFNNRVLTRAQSVLTPAQLNAFQSSQEQQVQMMEMGMKMSQQMFGGGAKNAGAPPPPTPVPAPK